MTTFFFEGKPLSHQSNETVLDALLRQGIAINYSCRKGVCRGCICRAEDQSPNLYTKSLPPDLIEMGYFLPCMTLAYEGLGVKSPNEAELPNNIKSGLTGGTKKKEVATPSSRREQPWPAPCPELWKGLQQKHDKLKAIIDDFYDAVFEDDLLSPYFQKFTKQRSKEKVYSFYKQLFSGEKCYFGDRPHNAHHWMVIPDEIFDHRLELLQHFMNVHGLSENLQSLWLPYENYYRPDIVKSEPLGRWIGDVYQPPGGMAYETLDEGTFCDSCEAFIDKGVTVLFETRTGKVYCDSCHTSPQDQAVNQADPIRTL